MRTRVLLSAFAVSLSAVGGELLYNGIRLPDEWPPRTDAFARKAEPAKPFYLEAANIPDPIPVDLGRQLFVDDFLVADMKGLRREYPHPEKYAGNPVLKPETWLERNGTHNWTARPNGGGLWWDPLLGCYRLWYEAGWLNAIAYATSTNGVDFVRPVIADGTNQIYPADLRPDSWEVVPDYAAPNPYARWCLFLSGPGGDEPSMLLESKNGTCFENRTLTGRCGDRSNFFYNPFRSKWVYSIRAWSGKGGAGRAVSYFEADEFPGKCTWEWNPKTPGESKDLVAWARADEKDGVDPEYKCPAQLYALSAVAYESILVGAFEIHRGPDNLAASETGNPKITDIVFAYSRDGFHWTRPDRTPAIPASRWGSGKWDAGYVQPLGNLFVIQDEKLRFYYGAFAGNTNRLSKIGHNIIDNGMYDNGAMGFASLRRDGFAAIVGEGELTTRRVSFTRGDRLFVNADCSRGELEVEVLGGAKRTLRGVDSTKIEVVAAKPGTVQVRFRLRGGAKLYSFWFSDASGASTGYLGGGGPDYPGLRDVPLAKDAGASSDAEPLTGEQIIARPRPAVPEIVLPKEGLFFGPATYGDEPTIRRDASGEAAVALCYAGHTHCRWVAGQPAPIETVALTKDLNQGNLIQFWQTDEKLFTLCEAAAKSGLYSMNIYAPDNPAVAKKLCGLGGFWLGHDAGEIFGYRGDDVATLKNPTLKDVTDAFMRRVHAYVAQRHASGWGNVLSTGGDFSMDLQVAAGIDIPLTEDYPFRNQLVSSALERGVARQYGLKLWGTHQAHEWNAFIPYANELRQPLLGATLQVKYMTGAKVIVNESGNWEVQTTLCEDSPMHRMPHVNPCKTICGPDKVRAAGFDLDAATEKARSQANLIGWRSEASKAYRKTCSDFWDFVKRNPAPKGQPEATFAVIKGNYDLSGERIFEGAAIGGARKLADKDANWYPGTPERSWALVKDVFSPCPDEVLYPSKNFFLSGSPYGLFDITSFAYDNTSAEFLLKHYKALMFAGWNTCSPKQYRILCDYVKGGGRLVVAIPHLSCDVTRKYATFTKEDLVNGGDFSELCGVKVKARGPSVWWATAPDPDRTKVNCLGLRWPRRYGILALPVGDLEYTLPASDYEKLAVEDEGGDIPVILRVKRGKGEVFFVNTWCYPSVADKDEGPGASFGSKGLMSTLYAYVAKISRGSVYIDGVGQDGPDDECRYVVCSHFPEDGRTFLKNVDFRKSHKVDLVRNGRRQTLVLAPSEMRIER